MAPRLALTPHGRLYWEASSEALNDSTAVSRETEEILAKAFSQGSAPGLLALAAGNGESRLWPAELLFWREFARTFLTALAHATDSSDSRPRPVGMPVELGFDPTLRIPAMRGAEYASPEVFTALWQELNVAAEKESAAAGGVRLWLLRVNPALHLLGRVTFHLAENKRSEATPFAFMATYTHRLSAGDKPVHLPLARALQEYAGSKNQSGLRALLEPIRLAAEKSGWLRDLLESRRVFQPQMWTAGEAHTFLGQVPVLEEAGIITRIPDWWRHGRGRRPKVSIRVGDQRGAGLGVDTMLQFSVGVTLGDEALSEEEWKQLMAAEDGLVPLRGQWVEVDREKLRQALDHWKRVEKGAAGSGLPFLEAMRLLSGARLRADGEEDVAERAEWSEVAAGSWLRETLERLRKPGQAAEFDPNEHLNAQLRPYQEEGVKWLWFLQSLGLGACLADDMGLGKTIQVIALLLRLKHGPDAACASAGRTAGPSLLIVPASLLANWKNELARFAPDLQAGFMHPSETPAGEWRAAEEARAFIRGRDVMLTTYGQAARLDWLREVDWRLIILDEAQAIKNPGAKVSKAVKRLRAAGRIALSGTPVENRPGDLWSLYDFLNPGLLGAANEFSRYVKRLRESQPPNFAPLRQLVRPYLLRRLKTDRAIIADLPDKTEVTAWCSLSKRQAALYEKSVTELKEKLEEAEEGIQRRGLVLAFLMRFKQICNHPSHWTGDGAFGREESGKFRRLTELCEEIASRQEKVLVFTQFREMTEPLAEQLREAFGRPGPVLHGATPVKERQQLVAQFQRDDGPPFFVLSLKAGGTGLNLTAASHVIHFDRWWNPAVENQATDRAFRIGQKKNVLVHKFVCRGTVEERIDALIQEKRELADSILGAEGGAEKLLTEMSNEELLRFVALDLNSGGSE